MDNRSFRSFVWTIVNFDIFYLRESLSCISEIRFFSNFNITWDKPSLSLSLSLSLVVVFSFTMLFAWRINQYGLKINLYLKLCNSFKIQTSLFTLSLVNLATLAGFFFFFSFFILPYTQVYKRIWWRHYLRVCPKIFHHEINTLFKRF